MYWCVLGRRTFNLLLVNCAVLVGWLYGVGVGVYGHVKDKGGFGMV